MCARASTISRAYLVNLAWFLTGRSLCVVNFLLQVVRQVHVFHEYSDFFVSFSVLVELHDVRVEHGGLDDALAAGGFELFGRHQLLLHD